jgi:hypothetical protein
VTRTSLPVAAAVAVSAGLLLTACGGGGSDSSDKIQSSSTGTPTVTATTAKPSPTATASEPSAPKFALPADAKVEFTGFESPDAATKSVLRDVKNAVMSMQEADSKGQSTANLKRYFIPLQAAVAADSSIDYRKSGYTITGTVKDYLPTVKFDAPNRAQVTYCEDERQAFDKEIATGKVDRSKPSLQDFSLWRMGMAKNAAGDWQVASYSQQKGVSKCAVS